jgi:hypothetical protein
LRPESRAILGEIPTFAAVLEALRETPGRGGDVAQDTQIRYYLYSGHYYESYS